MKATFAMRQVTNSIIMKGDWFSPLFTSSWMTSGLPPKYNVREVQVLEHKSRAKEEALPIWGLLQAMIKVMTRPEAATQVNREAQVKVLNGLK